MSSQRDPPKNWIIVHWTYLTEQRWISAIKSTDFRYETSEGKVVDKTTNLVTWEKCTPLIPYDQPITKKESNSLLNHFKKQIKKNKPFSLPLDKSGQKRSKTTRVSFHSNVLNQPHGDEETSTELSVSSIQKRMRTFSSTSDSGSLTINPSCSLVLNDSNFSSVQLASPHSEFIPPMRVSRSSNELLAIHKSYANLLPATSCLSPLSSPPASLKSSLKFGGPPASFADHLLSSCAASASLTPHLLNSCAAPASLTSHLLSTSAPATSLTSHLLNLSAPPASLTPHLLSSSASSASLIAHMLTSSAPPGSLIPHLLSTSPPAASLTSYLLDSSAPAASLTTHLLNLSAPAASLTPHLLSSSAAPGSLIPNLLSTSAPAASLTSYLLSSCAPAASLTPHLLSSSAPAASLTPHLLSSSTPAANLSHTYQISAAAATHKSFLHKNALATGSNAYPISSIAPNFDSEPSELFPQRTPLHPTSSILKSQSSILSGRTKNPLSNARHMIRTEDKSALNAYINEFMSNYFLQETSVPRFAQLSDSVPARLLIPETQEMISKIKDLMAGDSNLALTIEGKRLTSSQVQTVLKQSTNINEASRRLMEVMFAQSELVTYSLRDLPSNRLEIIEFMLIMVYGVSRKEVHRRIGQLLYEFRSKFVGTRKRDTDRILRRRIRDQNESSAANETDEPNQFTSEAASSSHASASFARSVSDEYDFF